jgi:flagellar biosynthesis protein FlhF
MRIKTYIAQHMPQALAMVREEMGADAIIVSSETRRDGTVKVIAALEPEPPAPGPEAAAEDFEPFEPFAAPASAGPGAQQAIAEALAGHGVPEELARRLVAAAEPHRDLAPERALAAVCEARLRFGGAPFRPSLRPIVLVGPPGAGKTTTCAKLAAQALLSGLTVDLMGADMAKTGALDQLAGLAKRMGLTVETADSEAALASAWRLRRRAHETAGRSVLAIVDTTGANPFDPEEMERTAAVIAGMRGHGVLVLPAGGDPLEAADTALAFAGIGATHLIVTRVDAARRLGSLVTAAAVRGAEGPLKLAGVGISPRIGNGLRPLNPVSLARLLLAPAEAGSAYRWNDGSEEQCA